MAEDVTNKNNERGAMLYFLYITVLNFIVYFGYRYIVDNLKVNDNGYLISFFLVSTIIVFWVKTVEESEKFSADRILMFIFVLPFVSLSITDICMLFYFAMREIGFPITSEHGIDLFKVILIILYFLPSFVSFNRQHPSRLAISFANVLLGWTVIGWIITLIWSGTAVKKQV